MAVKSMTISSEGEFRAKIKHQEGAAFSYDGYGGSQEEAVQYFLGRFSPLNVFGMLRNNDDSVTIYYREVPD